MKQEDVKRNVENFLSSYENGETELKMYPLQAQALCQMIYDLWMKECYTEPESTWSQMPFIGQRAKHFPTGMIGEIVDVTSNMQEGIRVTIRHTGSNKDLEDALDYFEIL